MSRLKQYLEGTKHNNDLTELLDELIYQPKAAEIIASSIERAALDAKEGYFNPKEFIIKLQANLDDIVRKNFAN